MGGRTLHSHYFVPATLLQALWARGPQNLSRLELQLAPIRSGIPGGATCGLRRAQIQPKILPLPSPASHHHITQITDHPLARPARPPWPPPPAASPPRRSASPRCLAAPPRSPSPSPPPASSTVRPHPESLARSLVFYSQQLNHWLSTCAVSRYQGVEERGDQGGRRHRRRDGGAGDRQGSPGRGQHAILIFCCCFCIIVSVSVSASVSCEVAIPVQCA